MIRINSFFWQIIHVVKSNSDFLSNLLLLHNYSIMKQANREMTESDNLIAIVRQEA